MVRIDDFCDKDREHWVGDEVCFRCRWKKCSVWRNLEHVVPEEGVGRVDG